MQKFPGQGSHLSRSSDNVVSLTAWPPGNSSPCDSCSDLLVASHVCHECSVLLATPGPLSSCLVLGTWLGSQPPADLPSLPPTTVAAPVDTWTGSCSIIGGGSEEPRVWESSSCLLPWRLETRPAFLRVHGCSPCCSAKNNGAVGNGLWSWTWSFWGRMISRSLVFFRILHLIPFIKILGYWLSSITNSFFYCFTFRSLQQKHGEFRKYLLCGGFVGIPPNWWQHRWQI